jgi:DNA repair exonuclease SbcCD ATPase subunit
MIIFEKVRYKNFFSVGNVFIEMPLNEVSSTLLVGKNGSGKSSLNCAITFALFGKPFRKINKSQIVNSVNKKDCVVEIEFRINTKKYKIVRGIKPNIFEIWCDGVCLNQDSTTKDYQEYLEKYILRMSYKSFCQIVILGSASFTPFMQLSSSDRRAVIEDLLDIQVFSVMTGLTKQRFQTNKDTLERNRISLAGKEDKLTFIESTLKTLQQNTDQKVKTLQAQIKENQNTVETLNQEIASLESKREEFLSNTKNITSLRARYSKLIKLQSQIETNLSRHKTEYEFYEKNDDCPTCKQALEQTFKTTEMMRLEEKTKDLKTGISDLSKEIDKCLSEISTLEKNLTKAENLRNEITSKKSKAASVVSSISDFQKQIQSLRNSNDLLTANKKEHTLVKTEIATLSKEKQALLEEKQYIDTAVQLLKDGGIKTKIIKQYLPIINKMINKYLAQMGFFVNFHINEQFEETIKSRFRDDFSYNNFSEGEKSRINLAILFAWRAVAKMRNSVNTNILFFDEIFDGSMDHDGTDEFVKIMSNLDKDTNVFVISHKTDAMIDKFKKVITFEKVRGFTRMIE